MSDEIHDAEVVSNLPAVRERSSVLLMPVMSLDVARSRLREFEEFCAHYLLESKDGGNDGGDYGVIPGTKKKTLLKSGSDKLAELYGLYDEYIAISSVEDWDKGLFDYTLKCILKSRRDDSMVGTGVGSCSSFESKYRWRDSKRKCPLCGKETIIKGQAAYGVGWICWFKEGRSDGCKAKFSDSDKSIVDQVVGRIENPDIVDAKNTVLKMAKKRAKIDAVIGVTRSSGIFTQDMDDIPMPPPKPEVERTTQDIPIKNGATGNSSGADSRKGPASAPPETGGVDAGSTGPVPASSGIVYIDQGRKLAFARAFKTALSKDNQRLEERLRHEWLVANKFVDADGVGTSAMIPMKDFERIKAEAVKFAKGLSGASPEDESVI